MSGYRMAQPALFLDASSDDGYESESMSSIASTTMSSSTFKSRVSEFGMQCVVKNTFLQLQVDGCEDEDGSPCQSKRNSQVRSHSAPKKLSHSSISSRSSSAASLVEPVSSTARPYLAYLTMDRRDQVSHSALDDACPTDLSYLDMKGSWSIGDFNDSCSTDITSSSESEMCESFGGYRCSNTNRTNVPSALAPTQPPSSQFEGVDWQEHGPMETMGMMELHNAGQCRPCLYFNSKSSCMNGSACRFCHFPHADKKKRTRPSKAVRLQCKQMAEQLKVAFGEDTQEFEKASTFLSKQSEYMRSLLQPKRALC